MHILITGASKGIGLAIAKRFANSIPNGLSLSVCSRNSDSLVEARAEIERASAITRVFSALCDVSKSDDVERFVAESEKEFGPVDVLINNAGFGFFHSVLGMDSADF